MQSVGVFTAVKIPHKIYYFSHHPYCIQLSGIWCIQMLCQHHRSRSWTFSWTFSAVTPHPSPAASLAATRPRPVPMPFPVPGAAYRRNPSLRASPLGVGFSGLTRAAARIGASFLLDGRMIFRRVAMPRVFIRSLVRGRWRYFHFRLVQIMLPWTSKFKCLF